MLVQAKHQIHPPLTQLLLYLPKFLFHTFNSVGVRGRPHVEFYKSCNNTQYSKCTVFLNAGIKLNQPPTAIKLLVSDVIG